MAAAAQGSWLSRLSSWVSKHPVATAAAIACAAGGVWLVSELTTPERVFKEAEDDDDGSASVNSALGNRGEAVAAVAEAVKKANVCNRFTRRQLLGLYGDWKRDNAGSDSLTLVQFAKLFSSMGVTDELVIRSLFDAWDTDRDGTVDFSELLNAIAITAGGSMEEKLRLCFRAFDLNSDGSVEPEELGHFFEATRAALGKPVDAAEVKRRVATVFSLCDENKDGHITEQEFYDAAMRHNFFKKGGLFEDFEQAMQLFVSH